MASDELLNEDSAKAIWDVAVERLDSDDMTTQGILKQFDIRALCTTDDPVDDLAHHQAISGDPSVSTQVLPAFRPDRAFWVHQPDEWNPWVDRLAAVADVDISSCAKLLDALSKRHDFFHEMGSRLSDHGMEFVPAEFISDQQAAAIFDKARLGTPATPLEHAQFSTYVLEYTARLDAEKNWTKQLHVGVIRNNNSRLFDLAGRDIGCDSISDSMQVKSLGAFLNRLETNHCLPKTIVYNLNPADNYVFATMLGNFQDGKNCRQNANGKRLVVSRPARRNGMADELPIQHRSHIPLRRHANRLTKLHVVSPSRIFSPNTLRSLWS